MSQYFNDPTPEVSVGLLGRVLKGSNQAVDRNAAARNALDIRRPVDAAVRPGVEFESRAAQLRRAAQATQPQLFSIVPRARAAEFATSAG